jgi:HSP20 family protein
MEPLIPSKEQRDKWLADIQTRMNSLQADVNKIFENFMTGKEGFTLPSIQTRISPFLDQSEKFLANYIPKINIQETDKEFLITAEVPGMDEKDIQLSHTGDKLVIQGEKKIENEKSEKGEFHIIESSYGVFKRVVDLPGEVDFSKISATYKNGVLKINVPKNPSKAATKIEIKSEK